MRDADGTARQLLDELFASTSEEDMRLNFDALATEMKWRRSEQDRMEREAMKRARKSGGASRPRPVRRVSEADMQAARDAWS